MSSGGDRHILHVDMDAFFAAVEQLDDPALRGQPVLVGGDPQGRGVVSAASYEARPFGCRSAMPTAQALRLCPEAVVVRPRMKRYVEVSGQVFGIMEQFTPLVEPLSIDEAFLDVAGSVRLYGPPERMGAELKRRIHTETGLTASVGVAPNKFLAKLASDLEKPDGLVIVPRDGIEAFLDPLPIERLWGVGRATLKRFERMGVGTFAEVRRLSEEELRRQFGEAGSHFYRLVRGIDEREVVPDRQAKSISHEVTFPVDVKDVEHLRGVLLDQTEHVARRLRRHGLLARTVNLKVRTGDFKTITRSSTLAAGTDRTDVLWEAASSLLEKWSGRRPRPVRLIGVGVSQLGGVGGEQLTLFEEAEASRGQRLDRVVDEIQERFGDRAVYRGGAAGRPKP
ncbi:MAG TPA: DNA polymerase IV [Phycisphaerae bacterium]|nr:DNA polymerase IV [Phycisphaerae bacterium]